MKLTKYTILAALMVSTLWSSNSGFAATDIDIKAGPISFENIGGGCNPDQVNSEMKIYGEYTSDIKYQVDLDINGTRVEGYSYQMPYAPVEKQGIMWGATLSEYRDYLKFGENKITVIFDSKNQVKESDETNNEVTFTYNMKDCSATNQNQCGLVDQSTVILDYRYAIVLNADAIKEGEIADSQHQHYGVKYSTLKNDSDLISTYNFSAGKISPFGLKVVPKSGSYDSDDAAVIEFTEPVKLVNIHTYSPTENSPHELATMKIYDAEGELLGCTGPWNKTNSTVFGFESKEGISKVVIDYGNEIPEEINQVIIEELSPKFIDWREGKAIPELGAINTTGATTELDDFYIDEDGVVYDSDQDRVFAKVCHTETERKYPNISVSMRAHMSEKSFNMMNPVHTSNANLVDQKCFWAASQPLTNASRTPDFNLINGEDFHIEIWADSSNIVTEGNVKNNNFQKTFKFIESTAFQYETDESKPLYKDIDTVNEWNTTWYVKPVSMMTWAGIFKGYQDGHFRPEGKITIAQVAKVAILGAGIAEPGLNTVKEGEHWATKYMSHAQKKQLFDDVNYTDQSIWNREATRVETVKALVRAFKLSSSEESTNCFADVSNAEVCVAQKWGILDDGGDDKTFNPDRSVNRAEMATMVFRKMYEPF